jgi:hypothetical protein
MLKFRIHLTSLFGCHASIIDGKKYTAGKFSQEATRTWSGRVEEQTVIRQVLTAVSTKMAVLWVVAPCSPCCLHHQGDSVMVEAARTSETLVNFYQTTRRYNPDDSHLNTLVVQKTSESKTFCD